MMAEIGVLYAVCVTAKARFRQRARSHRSAEGDRCLCRPLGFYLRNLGERRLEQANGGHS